MLWVLRTPESLEVLPTDWTQDWGSHWESFFSGAQELLYGGFLWPEIVESRQLADYHSRLLLDFAAGWPSVSFVARGLSLGSFSPPTAARPHESAPFGMYLYSGEALLELMRDARAQLPTESLELAQQLHQKPEGRFFCDPFLEVDLKSGHEFLYSEPDWRQGLQSLTNFVKRGQER